MDEVGSIRDPRDLVIEYNENLASLPDKLKAFRDSVEDIERTCTISGAYSRRSIFRDQPRADLDYMEKALLGSAWWAAFEYCNMKVLATAADKKKFEQEMQNPPEFTEYNLVNTFGPYLADPRDAILRGLAEAFITLDPAYKSHSNVKVGVKGLPKRVIINNARSSWGYSSYGWDKAKDMLNALKVFDGDGLVDQLILNEIRDKKRLSYRGMEFKWYLNGNLHIIFGKHACLQINRGLSEYYGDVLPDVEPDKDDLKADPNARELAKDLQYFPTPVGVANSLISYNDLYGVESVLEPSCGCGRLMDVVKDCILERENHYHREPLKEVSLVGIEYDLKRATEAREKGHKVIVSNFLEVEPREGLMADLVIMNPPFYGRHYLKHINHAMKFLNSGGRLISILPATAHYDHKELPQGYSWRDLPVGSFAESGTRVPTGYASWGR